MKQTKRIPVEAQADIQFSQYFLNRDIKGAIAYMREHEEFKDILPAYTVIFCFSFEARGTAYCGYETISRYHST